MKTKSICFRIISTILLIPFYFPLLILKYILNTINQSKQCNKCNRKELNGKVVLITGASGGLGEALAHVFFKAGCKVILAARRLDELKRVKKELLLHSKVFSNCLKQIEIINIDYII